MEGDIEAEIQYDTKKGRIIIHGLESGMVKEVVKILGKRKHITIQILADGFAVSQDGLYFKKVESEERPIGYG